MKNFDLSKFKNRNKVKLSELTDSFEEIATFIDMASCETFSPIYVYSSNALELEIDHDAFISSKLMYYVLSPNYLSTLAEYTFESAYKSRGYFKLYKETLLEIYGKGLHSINSRFTESSSVKDSYSWTGNCFLFAEDEAEDDSVYLINTDKELWIGDLFFDPHILAEKQSITKPIIERSNKREEILSYALCVLKKEVEKCKVNVLTHPESHKLNVSELVRRVDLVINEKYPEDKTKGFGDSSLMTTISKALEITEK